MRALERLATFLQKHPYHPRSNQHSNALLEFLLADLLEICPALAADAQAGKIAYDLNRKIRVGPSEWNVDLAVGPSSGGDEKTGMAALRIRRAQPSNFRIACEAKSIMTEHRKAQRNRLRDLDALHQFVHRYDQNAIVATVTVVNISERFRSPLRPKTTRHDTPTALAATAIELLRTLPLRSHPHEGPGLEANTVIVLDYDNSGRKPHSRVFTKRPAPQPGDPLHWDSFLRRICDLYVQRWFGR